MKHQSNVSKLEGPLKRLTKVERRVNRFFDKKKNKIDSIKEMKILLEATSSEKSDLEDKYLELEDLIEA